VEQERPGGGGGGMGDKSGIHEPDGAESVVAEPLGDGGSWCDDSGWVEVVFEAEVGVGQGAAGIPLAADEGPAVKGTPDVFGFIRAAERAGEALLNAAPLFIVVIIPGLPPGDGFADAAGEGVIAVGDSDGAVREGDQPVPGVPREGAAGLPTSGFRHGGHVARGAEYGGGHSGGAGQGGDLVGFVVGAALCQGRTGGVVREPVSGFIKAADFGLLEIGDAGVVGGGAGQVAALMLIVLLETVIPKEVVLPGVFRSDGTHGVGQDIALPSDSPHGVSSVAGVHQLCAARLPDGFDQTAKPVEAGEDIPGVSVHSGPVTHGQFRAGSGVILQIHGDT